MGILDFEAYWLEYLHETAEGYYDDNGDFHPGVDEWLPFGKVDAEPHTGPDTVSLPDGHTDEFSFSIHIHDSRCREFCHGDRLRITNPYGEKFLLAVKGFARHQTKCVIQADGHKEPENG